MKIEPNQQKFVQTRFQETAFIMIYCVCID